MDKQNKFCPKQVAEIAKKAGTIVMTYYKKEDLDKSRKEDFSPVTEADIHSSEFIISELKKITPDTPVVSEENNVQDNLNIMNNYDEFWLIDPIDGTWSFIKGEGEFTVNIALIKNGAPIFGVIYSPLTNANYYNDMGGKAFKESNGIITEIFPNNSHDNGIDFLVSHQNLNQKMQDFVSKFEIKTVTPIPSSIKLALMAEGKGDIYPRFKPTSIWDTASGDAILRELGGGIMNAYTKEDLSYNTQIENPHFIAYSSASLKDLIIARVD